MPFYVCTAGQRFCTDLDHLSRFFAGGKGRADDHAAAGIRLHCRGHAAGAGRAGDHGSYVQRGVWRDLYGGISDAVAVCDAGDQFLFCAGGQSGGGGAEPPVCASQERRRGFV